MASEPGIIAVHHPLELGYYPWQVLIEGDRCLLLSGDFKSRAVISSRHYPGKARTRSIPLQDVLQEGFDAVQAVLRPPLP
jgi:hypothetical protein